MSMTGDDITKIGAIVQTQLEPLGKAVDKLEVKLDKVVQELSERGAALATVIQKVADADCSAHQTKLDDIQLDVDHAHEGIHWNRRYIFGSLIVILGAMAGAYFLVP